MSRFSGKVVVPALVVGAAVVAVPALWDASHPTSVYCTDSANVIVDDTRCDNTNGVYGYGHGYYLHRGYYPTGYGVGSVLPAPRSGHPTTVDASDSGARSKAGYSSSGKVSSGKTGGFGFSKGGSSGGGDGGSGSHGSSGGGKSGGS